MAPDDTFTLKEWAKRYRLTEEQFDALCEKTGHTPDTEFTRENFKELIKEPLTPQASVEAPETPPPEAVKEERVTEERRTALSKLAAEKGITRPCVAALKVYTGWEDSTKITEAELVAAVDKYLKEKE